MEFQLAHGVAHLFADAVAAYIRSRAHVYQTDAEQQAWHTLWLTFRDADTTSVTVGLAAARLMFWVWGKPDVWRDEQTRQAIRAQLRPQWREQLASLPV